MLLRRTIQTPYVLLEPDSRRYFEKALLEAFAVAVETEDPAEEGWAAGIVRDLHGEAIAELDDRAPRLFDAMAWAAQQHHRATPVGA